MSATKLTMTDKFNAKNMVFASPKVLEIPSIKGSKYIIVPIAYKNEDKTVGDLCLLTEKLFCFGISEPFQADGAYTIGLSMYSRDNITDAEKAFMKNVTALLKHARDHLKTLKTHPDFVKNKLTITEDKLNEFETTPVKYPKDKATGQLNMNSPTMNIKLMYSTLNGVKTVTSHIVDGKGRKLNPVDLIKKYGTAQCVLKFEGLFIGKSIISCQIKLTEAVVEQKSGRPVLLFAPACNDEDNADYEGGDAEDEDIELSESE